MYFWLSDERGKNDFFMGLAYNG